ncbi:MAG: hypothetical protein ACK4WH_03535 [Phycisphaerales bacterium]
MPAVAVRRGSTREPHDPDGPSLTLARPSAPSNLPKAQRRLDPLPISRWSSVTLSDRVRALCAGKTPQMLSRLTGASTDAVRRYLRGAAAPPAFLAALAGAMGVSLNWLLSGRGPIRRVEVTALALERASTAELFGELNRRLASPGEPRRS